MYWRDEEWLRRERDYAWNLVFEHLSPMDGPAVALTCKDWSERLKKPEIQASIKANQSHRAPLSLQEQTIRVFERHLLYGKRER